MALDIGSWPSPRRIQRPNRRLFQQRAPKRQVRCSAFNLLCPVSIKSLISSQPQNGFVTLLCLDFTYIASRHWFFSFVLFCVSLLPGKRWCPMTLEGIQLKQARQSKQKGTKEYHENLWHSIKSVCRIPQCQWIRRLMRCYSEVKLFLRNHQREVSYLPCRSFSYYIFFNTN